jgi:hypothetical protein
MRSKGYKMLKNFILFVTVCFLSILNAETTQKPENAHLCAPCDEPLAGTALWHYMKGIEELIGVRTNAYLANEHFKRAADMNYAPAIKALADSCYSGDGVDEDKNQALLLYLRAADLGDGAAQFNAGVILLCSLPLCQFAQQSHIYSYYLKLSIFLNRFSLQAHIRLCQFLRHLILFVHLSFFIFLNPFPISMLS